MPRALVVSHSFLERDPRVRRTVDTLLGAGWAVDGLFLDEPIRRDALRTWRVPLARRRGSTLRYLLEYGVFFVATALWVLGRAVLRRADLVFVNSPPEAFALAALPARLRRTPVVLDIHDPMPELFTAKGRRSTVLRRALEWQERWGARAADAVITVHEPLRDLLQRRLTGIPMDVVMNVPDTSALSPLPPAPGSRTIVYTGSVARRYGLDDLFRAVARCTAAVPGLAIRLIGEGEDVESLRALAAELGIAARVEWVGRVPHARIRAVQTGAWLGVNLPKPDALGHLSFSNKIVEWVAMRLPVVASRTPTLLRYFPEDTLFYTDPADPAALADLLVRIDALDPVEMEARLDRAAAALEEIGWPIQQARLLGVLERVTGGRGAGGSM